MNFRDHLAAERDKLHAKWDSIAPSLFAANRDTDKADLLDRLADLMGGAEDVKRAAWLTTILAETATDAEAVIRYLAGPPC